MSISDGQFNLADVKVSAVSGMRGVGVNRLQFALELQLNATPDYTAVIREPLCFVSVSRTQAEHPLPLGHAIPETRWFRHTSPYASREGFSLFLYLSAEQLSQLEKLRGGGAFFFRLDLHAIVDGKRGVQRAFEQLWFEANLSTWSTVLRDLGHFDLLLLAVELPVSDVPKELHSCVDQLREAHRDLIAGRYDSVVRRVRLCVEGTKKVTSIGQKDDDLIDAFITSRKRMSKKQRSDLVRLAIHHYAHLAHHPDDQGVTESFSRHEALFILSATASLLWDVIGTMQTVTEE